MYLKYNLSPILSGVLSFKWSVLSFLSFWQIYTCLREGGIKVYSTNIWDRFREKGPNAYIMNFPVDLRSNVWLIKHSGLKTPL